MKIRRGECSQIVEGNSKSFENIKKSYQCFVIINWTSYTWLKKQAKNEENHSVSKKYRTKFKDNTLKRTEKFFSRSQVQKEEGQRPPIRWHCSQGQGTFLIVSFSIFPRFLSKNETDYSPPRIYFDYVRLFLRLSILGTFFLQGTLGLVFPFPIDWLQYLM